MAEKMQPEMLPVTKRQAGIIIGLLIAAIVTIWVATLWARRPEPTPKVDPTPIVVSPPVDLPQSKEIIPGDWTEIEAKAETKVTWWVPPVGGIKTKVIANTIVVLGREEGVYFIGANTVKDGAGSEPVWVRIKVNKPPPDPPQPPIDPKPVDPPKPPTPPVVGTAKFWVIVVHDAKDPSPATSKLLGSEYLRKTLIESGHKIRVHDKDSERARTLGYLRKAEETGMPTLILLEEDGKLKKALKLPDSELGILQAIKDNGGAVITPTALEPPGRPRVVPEIRYIEELTLELP